MRAFPRTIRQHLSSLKVCNVRRSYSFLDKNRLSVNGERIVSWDRCVDAEHDEIALNGEVLPKQKFAYIALNKPCGYVCSTASDRSPTVYDLLPQEYKELHSAGRLDKDTSGLLILTDDGIFSHWLTSPGTKIWKKYRVRLKNYVSPWEQYDYEKRCREGISLPACEKSPAFTTQGATLEWIDAGLPELGCCASVSECYVTICEGKFHQIRRMFRELGNEVVQLRRVAIGSLELEGLAEGECVPVNPQSLLL